MYPNSGFVAGHVSKQRLCGALWLKLVTKGVFGALCDAQKGLSDPQTAQMPCSEEGEERR